MDRSKIYFAQDESKDCVKSLINKIDSYYDTLESNGMMNKYRNSYASYYGASFESVGEAHRLTFGGTEGELAQLVINDYHNIAQHMLVAITSNRPALEAKAVNSDYKSLAQSYLATGLLEYYLKEQDLEEYVKRCVEYGIVFGKGYIKLRWNSLLGKLLNQQEYNDYLSAKEQGYNVDTVIPDYEGDIEYDVLSAIDVVFDLKKESLRHDWYICRTQKNRYDLIATYPELETEIMSIDNVRDLMTSTYDKYADDTDDIEVWEFYHRRSEAVPNGRYIFFASEDAIFFDGDLPYRNIPLYPISPSLIMGTGIGYTPMFDALPIQEASDIIHSTILSNQLAFGAQTILNPQGSNINVNQIGEGLTIMDYNPQAGKPEPLKLLDTPKELFEYLNLLQAKGETLTGISSVVRGNPEASLRSGTSLALIQSNSIQFLSGLQASYIRLLEHLGMGVIEMLQDFADSPRVATIVGESGQGYMREFKSEDIRDIKRIIVDVGNPLANSISGRVSIADNLLQYQLLKSPDEYINIINTGNLRAATEDTVKESLSIRNENEFLMNGQPAIASILDNHQKHINSHKSLLADPLVRTQNNLSQAVLAHIDEHLNLWKNADVALLFATNQQPLPQPMMPPAPNGANPNGAPPSNPNQPMNIDETMQGNDVLPPQQQIESLQQNIRLPEGVEGPLTMSDNLTMNGYA